MSVQICPLFELSQLNEYPPQAGMSNVPWLKSLLREAALLDDFEIDTDWIRSRLNLHIQRKEIRKAIESLINTKFIIQVEGTRKFTVTKEQLVTEDEVQGAEIGKYYNAFYESIYEVAKSTPQSKLYWNYIKIRAANYQFESLRHELIALSKGMLEKERNCDKRNCILQISTQLIPLNQRKAI